MIQINIAGGRILEKDFRIFQATIRATDEWLDRLFALVEDKPEDKQTILSLTSSELDKIFADDP